MAIDRIRDQQVAPLAITTLKHLQLMEVVREHGKTTFGGHLFLWMQQGFVSTAGLSIRKMADDDNRSISLKWLLGDMRYHAAILTRQSFRDMYQQLGSANADNDFDHVAGEGQPRIPDHFFDEQLRELDRVAEKVRPLVNKHLAHTNERDVPLSIEFEDLVSAARFAESLYHKLALALRGDGKIPLADIAVHDIRPFLRLVWPKGQGQQNIDEPPEQPSAPTPPNAPD